MKPLNVRYITAYYLFCLGITWLIVAPLVLNRQLGFTLPTLPYHHYWAALGPVGAAALASLLFGKRVREEYFETITKWKVGWEWYVYALLGPVALFAAAITLTSLLYGKGPDWTQLGSFPDFGRIGLLGGFLVHTLTFGVGEEFGWHGLLLPKLQKRWNSLTATVVLSLLWAFWHIPMFFYREGYLAMGIEGIVGWIFSLFMGAIILTWLFNASNQSALIPALFHGTINVFFTTQAVAPETVNVMGALLMVWTTVILLTQGKRLGLTTLSQSK